MRKRRNLSLLRAAALCFFLAAFVVASDGRAEADGLDIVPQYSEAALLPEQPAELSVLITVKAPAVPRATKRPPAAVSLVMDRSGSMGEAKKIDYARMAAKTLVRNLEVGDQFSLTIYDDQVEVLYPLAAIRDKEKVLRMIDRIEPRGWTFLSGGLEQGIQLLEKYKGTGTTRVILLSDGLANRGVTNPEQVGGIGAHARAKGISVSTIGLGLDFDEDLMQHLAQRGGGQYYYIADSESLPSVFRDELNLVIGMFTKNMHVVFSPSASVQLANVYGYVTGADPKQTTIELGDLSSEDERQIMLRLMVAPDAAPGMQKLGEVSFAYVDQTSGREQTVVVPLELEVTADDVRRNALAAERAESVALVRNEVLLRDTDEASLAAMEELRKGNVSGARKYLQKNQAQLAKAAPANKAAENKLAQIRIYEQNLERAVSDAAVQQAMLKSSKSQAYKLAQGQKAGLMLQRGDKGYAVERLQRALAGKGVYTGAVDGIYSAEVEAAVKTFQKAEALGVDGIAGPATLKALNLQ